MSRGINNWDRDSEDSSPPADEKQFKSFEKKHLVRLPESFKALYRVQNGGTLQDVDSPEFLLPLGKSAKPDFEHIHSLA